MTDPGVRSGLGRFVGRSAAGAAGLVAAGVAFVLLTAAVGGRPGRVVGVDGWLAGRLDALVSPHPALVEALRVVTVLGDTAVLGLVGRLRPVVDVPLAAVGDPSFPSGHALGSTVVHGVVLLVAWPLLGRRARIGAAAATVAVLVAVGATRLALGVHHLLDLLGSLVLALPWLLVVRAVLRPGRPAPAVGAAPPAAGVA